MSVARFGFGLNSSGAYHYFEIDGERLEAPVTPKLGPVKSVASYDSGFIVFACEMRNEKYRNFYEYADVIGQLNKWVPLLESGTEIIVVNE